MPPSGPTATWPSSSTSWTSWWGWITFGSRFPLTTAWRPSPAFIQEHKLGIGMAQPAAIRDAAEKALTQAFGPGPWIEDRGRGLSLFKPGHAEEAGTSQNRRPRKSPPRPRHRKPTWRRHLPARSFLPAACPTPPLPERPPTASTPSAAAMSSWFSCPTRFRLQPATGHHPWKSLEL